MNQNVKKLTESAIMIALATVLSLIIVFQAPQGGSVTAASMVPIILISLKYSRRWSLLTAVAYAVVQMVIGFYPPPTQSFIYFLLVILLDYVFAFGALGLAGTFGRMFKKPYLQVVFGTCTVIAFRFVCHFISGIVIWNSYAPAGQPVWLYSLGYNGFYMLFEAIVSVIVVSLLYPFIKKYILPKK